MPLQPARAEHHPTKEKLISTVVEMLEDRDGLGIEEILSTAEVSTGSMYHHFEDVDDLLEDAYCRRFAMTVDDSIGMIDSGFRGITSQDEMKTVLKEVTRATQARLRAPVRYERARIAAMAEHNERFRLKLRDEQKRLTDALESLFAQMQGNGWMRADFDPRAAAVFIQAYTLGKVVDDFAEDRIEEEAWNAIIDAIVDHVFARI